MSKMMIKNNNGNISVIGMMLSLLIIAGSLMAILEMQNTNLLIRKKADAYLCFKFLTKTNKSYIKKMARLNMSLTFVYPLQFIAQSAAAAKLTHKILQYTQALVHLSYLKKITFNKYCSWYQKSFYIKNQTYKVTKLFKLKRDIDGSVGIRKKEWNCYVIPKVEFIERDLFFVLRASYKIKNKYSVKPKLVTKEIGKKDLQFLKLLPGLRSLLQSPQQLLKSISNLKNKI